MADEFLEVAAVTDVGNVRQYNEDSIAVDVENGILALADGMGGHRAGEVASRMATETAGRRPGRRRRRMSRPNARPACTTARASNQSINRANEAIFEAGRADVEATAAWGPRWRSRVFRDDRVTLAHVGDSRIYRVRDHRHEAADARRLAAARPGRAGRHLRGGGEPVAQPQPRHARARHRRDAWLPHLADETAVPGDIYLAVLGRPQRSASRTPTSSSSSRRCAANLPLAAQHLVQAAKDNGGFDNVSVILGARAGAASAGGSTPRLVRAAASRWLPRPRGAERGRHGEARTEHTAARSSTSASSTQARVTIGRDARERIVVDDPAIGRAHAAIAAVGNDYILEDLRQRQRHARSTARRRSGGSSSTGT